MKKKLFLTGLLAAVFALGVVQAQGLSPDQREQQARDLAAQREQERIRGIEANIRPQWERAGNNTGWLPGTSWRNPVDPFSTRDLRYHTSITFRDDGTFTSSSQHNNHPLGRSGEFRVIGENIIFRSNNGLTQNGTVFIVALMERSGREFTIWNDGDRFSRPSGFNRGRTFRLAPR